MKRTQIYIDHETYLKVKVFAKNRGKTFSQVIRDSLKEYVAKKEKIKKFNSLEMIAKLSEKYPDPPNTPHDLSFNHDHYIYGTPKRKIKK